MMELGKKKTSDGRKGKEWKEECLGKEEEELKLKTVEKRKIGKR